MENLKVKVESIMKTNFDDDILKGTYWCEYSVGGKYGYFISNTINEETPFAELEERIYNDKEFQNSLINKKNINECSEYLASLIECCRQSDNEMKFVEYDDLVEVVGNDITVMINFLRNIEKELENFFNDNYDLYGYILVNPITIYDSIITVFGGIISKFLF